MGVKLGLIRPQLEAILFALLILEGKKRMDAGSFLRGSSVKAGTVLTITAEPGEGEILTTLTVNGGTIVGTSDREDVPYKPDSQGDGSFEDGSALSIVSRGNGYKACPAAEEASAALSPGRKSREAMRAKRTAAARPSWPGR